MLQILSVPLHLRSMVMRFIRVPWFIHREHWPNNNWVPPILQERREFLDPNKNPFFGHADVMLWIAVKDGRDVGRIAAIIDQDYIRKHDPACGYFGLFECIDDQEIADALFERAHAWLAREGCERAIGPMDMSMHHTCGLLIDNFDRVPSFQMNYNPSYYPELVEKAGYRQCKDLFQWGLDARSPTPERIERVAQAVIKRENIKIRTMRMDDFDQEIERCLSLYNDCWAENWGFTPLSPREFHKMAKAMRTVLNPRLALFAEVDGETVAVSLTLNDINASLRKIDGRLLPSGLLTLAYDRWIQPQITGARLILLGIRSDYRRRGIDSLLFLETKRTALELGYYNGQIGWTLEDNHLVNRAIESMHGHKIGTYRIYTRELAAQAS